MGQQGDVEIDNTRDWGQNVRPLGGQMKEEGEDSTYMEHSYRDLGLRLRFAR